MKAVSLKRLDGLEGDLVDTFPNVNFVFTSGISEINDKDIQDLDVLVGYGSAIDQAFLEGCPSLKWLAWYSTGVKKLPLEYIDDQNLLLTNGKGALAKQTPEVIIAF